MAVKARVSLIREVPSGSWRQLWPSLCHQPSQSRLAVIAIGYADGVSPRLSAAASTSFIVVAHGLPQVGNITMDQMIVDATDVEDLDGG